MNLNSEKFRELLADRYLFHFHTTYTDGKVKIKEYFEVASKKNIQVLIFTEHVRKNLSYNFNEFAEEIKNYNLDYPAIRSLIGIEAKILPGGDLDVDEELLPLVDVLCFACHKFPKNIDLYYESFKHLFRSTDFKELIKVWVHPGRFLKKNSFLDSQIPLLRDLIDEAVSSGIFIEHNMKENLPPDIIKIPKSFYIKGYDIHTHYELERLSIG
jgi:histidinol phosphatase-like PHP family hydrolase